MADISKIQLPTGTTYDIKDAVARTPVSTTTTSDFVTASSGYTISSGTMVVCGKIAQLYLNVSPTSAMSISAYGNITNFTCATIKEGYRPLVNSVFAGYGDANGACGILQTTGTVRVCGFSPTGSAQTIAAGSTFIVACTYILA